MYRPEDFNLTNAPKEMVQFVIDSVVDFDKHYSRALEIIGADKIAEIVEKYAPAAISDYQIY